MVKEQRCAKHGVKINLPLNLPLGRHLGPMGSEGGGRGSNSSQNQAAATPSSQGEKPLTKWGKRFMKAETLGDVIETAGNTGSGAVKSIKGVLILPRVYLAAAVPAASFPEVRQALLRPVQDQMQ